MVEKARAKNMFAQVHEENSSVNPVHKKNFQSNTSMRAKRCLKTETRPHRLPTLRRRGMIREMEHAMSMVIPSARL